MLQKKATARARRAVVMLFVMNLKLALEYMTPRPSAGFSCRKQHQASKVKKKRTVTRARSATAVLIMPTIVIPDQRT